jgi:ubiquitin fusion degradation protein 1
MAEEGFIYLPQWTMEKLKLKEEGLPLVKSVALVKGTYIKLQPHATRFLGLSNSKSVLESTLGNSTCSSTVGDILF